MSTARKLTRALAIAAATLALAALSGGAPLDSSARTDVTPHGAEPRAGAPASPTVTVTISGTVTGPGGPVPGARVNVGSHQDWGEATTNAAGFYSLSMETDGELWFHVRPPISTRLSQAFRWVYGVTGDVTVDFTVAPGHLLSLRVTDSDGVDLFAGWLSALSLNPAENWWYEMDWDDASQRYQAVFQPGIYYVTVHDPPEGFYETTAAFDLRDGDVFADMPLRTTYVHPIPYEPPDAAKITIGPVDGLGEAVVTGAPGAALPLAYVLLVNLNSTHQAYTTSEADGSFTAKVYAPPGSAIMVKHGPPREWRWSGLVSGAQEGLNPFPGTIINVPHEHSGDAFSMPFAAAGAVDYGINDPVYGNYVHSAWAITGTIGPVVEGEWTRVLTGTYDGQAVPGLYLGGLGWTHPALGDLDGDGDLDMVVGENFGRLVLYRNLGSPAAPEWRFESDIYAGVDTGQWAFPALADVTGDGALDLFVGSGEGAVSIYYNAGTAAAPVWPDAPDATLSAGRNAAPALADIDNDGDLDLLVGHEGGALYHFKNTGTPANPAWTQQTAAYGGISEPGHGLQPSFVDMDGDGDLDLLIGRCGDVVWYRNNGPPSNPTWTRVADGYAGIGGSCGISPGPGDWDADGDPDMVVGHHLGRLRFYRNDGPPAAPSWALLGDDFFPFDFHADSAPAAADLDADGDLDLLVGQLWGDVHEVWNDGTSAEPDWSERGVVFSLPWTNHPHAFPALADIDADGDYDLFVGEGGWQGPGAGGNIHFYRNAGTAAAPNWTLVTHQFLGLDVGGWSRPAFADIDSDGDLDLFVGDEEGTLTFVENTGTASLPAWASPVQPYADLHLGEYSAPAFFDLDQDGDLDMLVGLGSGSLAYVRNTGTAQSPAWQLVTTAHPEIEVGEHATPTAADMNGDGKPDLLIGDGDGGLNLYLYQGPGAPPQASDTYAPGDPFHIQGTVRLYSQAITATTDLDSIAVNGWASLMMLFDGSGHSLASENFFMSTLLTPSGFPIQGLKRPEEHLHAGFTVDSLRYVGGHAVEGQFVVSGRLPEDVPPGTYRPLLYLDFAGVPAGDGWVAANVGYFTIQPREAALAPIVVEDADSAAADGAERRVIWRLLMDDHVQGTRGAGAREDEGTFQLASQIVSQGAPYSVPPVDVYTGEPITYRLEPFLPIISRSDRNMPCPPLIPFDLPGGQLSVRIQKPDGTVADLGSEPFAQSFHRSMTTRAGFDLNSGTMQLEDVYSLKAASNRFRATFDQFGHHVITMTGEVSDIWGNVYTGGGTYDVWVAYPLDIDAGVLPGTPLAAGDAFNPTMQFYPRVPAEVSLTVTLYPDSDPTRAVTQTLTGRANLYGYFSPGNTQGEMSNTQYPISLTHPGEYRVDLTAAYTTTTGELYMSAMTWGGVVMTPDNEAELIAHGRRGLDSLPYIPNHWFVNSRDLNIPEGAVSHSLNPYYNGDIYWSRMSDGPVGGDSLILGASVQDTVGAIEAAIRARADRTHPALAGPGQFSERFDKGEIPLFISTRSGRPVQMVPDDADQMAYSYRSSQRPGVRVREVVAEDGQSGGYWRLDTLYDDQLGVGILGDQPNDFKFQYVGVVYRDLDTGHSEYLGQGTGWIFIPDDDPTGSRVMPPFAGPGNGGWTTEGGPILTLKGKEVHIFVLPTGTRPGAVLEVGDIFRFAGHIMPTLNSQVAVTATAPSGAQHLGGGRANHVGYFYNPEDDFTVDERGLWSVDVRVWHDGQCSGGATIPPYPSGDVLGSEDGLYWFYVVPEGAPRLNVFAPSPGVLAFGREVTPIAIAGAVPAGLSDVTVDYTISMPGHILQHGQATIAGGTYTIVFDPVALAHDFPNLDVLGRHEPDGLGLSDTFAIGLLLRGQSEGGALYRANTVTIQGDQVFIGNARPDMPNKAYLPAVFRQQAIGE